MKKDKEESYESSFSQFRIKLYVAKHAKNFLQQVRYSLFKMVPQNPTKQI